MLNHTDFLFQQRTRQLEALLEITKTIATEPDYAALLKNILSKALEFTRAEGSSLLLIENKKMPTKAGVIPENIRQLRFHSTVNRGREVIELGQTMSLNEKSIAGYVALSNQSLRIRDCYTLDKDLPYSFNRSFDLEQNYRTKSMLAVPLKLPNGDVLGVIQLVNKLREEHSNLKTSDSKIPEKAIISFSDLDRQLMEAFATQAAIAIDNVLLVNEKKEQFKGFVSACVTAIESRDPTNSGHSARVSLLTVALARKVSDMKTGPFKNVRYSADEINEIRVAALLHDFGKIGVRESVLLKAKKLYTGELHVIMSRLEHTKASYKARTWEESLSRIINEKLDERQIAEEQQSAYAKIHAFNEQIEQVTNLILKANEPQVLAEDVNIDHLLRWLENISNDIGIQILTHEEASKLSVKRGSLTPKERAEMEAHVEHSYRFLSKISWSKHLEKVPYIAAGHHEKLDGSGYPFGLQNNEISLPTRMMAITDIFDSLTAVDRPYKKAVSIERTLEILTEDANRGKLDKDLLEIFINEKIYLMIQPAIMKKVAAF